MADLANWFKKAICRLESRNVNLLVLVTFLSIIVLTVLTSSIIAVSTGQFRGFRHALWWVTKAVLGPDYLDEEHGGFLAAVSFVVVLIGFVAFGSGTVALMSTLVAQKVENVRKGLSRLPFRNHIVILNSSSKLYEVLNEILQDDQYDQVAILSTVSKERCETTVVRLLPSERTQKKMIACREGSPLNHADLAKVNISEAARVVVLTPEDSGKKIGFRQDMSTLKLLALLNSDNVVKRDIPLIVEVNDYRSVHHIRTLIERKNLILVNGNRLIGNILCQASLQPHVAKVFGNILSYEGSEFYFKRHALPDGDYSRAEFFRSYLSKYSGDIPVGVRDSQGLVVNPDTWRIRKDTELITLSPDSSPLVESHFDVNLRGTRAANGPATTSFSAKVLIIGSNSKLHDILEGYRSFIAASRLCPENGKIEVTVLSDERIDLRDYSCPNLTVDQVTFDLVVHTDKVWRLLAEKAFDTIVVLSKEGVPSEEKDVNVLAAVLTILELRRKVPDGSTAAEPKIIVELLDPKTADILEHYHVFDVIVSTKVVSRYIAQCVGDPSRKALFDELMWGGDNEIYIKPATKYLTAGTRITFREIIAFLAESGEIPLGVVVEEKVLLNPGFDEEYLIDGNLQFVVLAERL